MRSATSVPNAVDSSGATDRTRLYVADVGVTTRVINIVTGLSAFSLDEWIHGLSIEAQRAYHRGALERLRRDYREKLAALITATFPGAALSAQTLWQLPELHAACLDADLTTVKQLGVWLGSWCERIGRDEDGIVWAVSADHLHEDP
jgi:hypothetical protein